MLMTETALGRLVADSERTIIAEDAVLRVLWILRTHPQNLTNEAMNFRQIARATLLPVSVVMKTLVALAKRGMVEQARLETFRLTDAGDTFVRTMPQGLRSVL